MELELELHKYQHDALAKGGAGVLQHLVEVAMAAKEEIFGTSPGFVCQHCGPKPFKGSEADGLPGMAKSKATYTVSAEAADFLQTVPIKEVKKGVVTDGKFEEKTPADGGKRMVRRQPRCRRRAAAAWAGASLFRAGCLTAGQACLRHTGSDSPCPVAAGGPRWHEQDGREQGGALLH